MFKRALLISALTIGASLSFTPSFAAPAGRTVDALGSCTSDCVNQAQSLAADIAAMPAGPAKDKLLIALVKAIGKVAIANPELSVSLASVAESAAEGLSEAAQAQVPFVRDVVAALSQNAPGDATATIDNPNFGEPASG